MSIAAKRYSALATTNSALTGDEADDVAAYISSLAKTASRVSRVTDRSRT
jgi:hypothetical protein